MPFDRGVCAIKAVELVRVGGGGGSRVYFIMKSFPFCEKTENLSCVYKVFLPPYEGYYDISIFENMCFVGNRCDVVRQRDVRCILLVR